MAFKQTNKKQFERDENELGILWAKKSDKGKYLSGFIEIEGEEIQIVVFPVNSDNPKAPDYRILKSVRAGEKTPVKQAVKQSVKSPKAKVVEQDDEQEEEKEQEEDSTPEVEEEETEEDEDPIL